MGNLNRHIRLLLSAAAVATTACFASAPSATAAGEAFYGVSVLETPSPAEFQTMSRGGVDTVRLPIYWEGIERTPGARVWSRYDALFAATATAGVEVLPLLHLSPSWMNANVQRPPLGRPEDLQAWTRFAADFAARYGRGGTFWTLNPTIPARPLTAYQIWNEPNLRFFWGGRPNPKGYMRLLRAARAGLQQGDPAAHVVSGGLFREPRRGTGVSAVKFLDRMYRQPGARAAIDAVGLHPYASRPKGVVDAIAASRRVMRARKDAKTPVWVTELGWAVAGLGLRGSPVKATPRQQAQRLKRTYRLLKARSDLRVKRAFWFSWRDFDSDPNAEEFWIYHMGLFDQAGNPRPAWNAFAAAAGGIP